MVKFPTVPKMASLGSVRASVLQDEPHVGGKASMIYNVLQGVRFNVGISSTRLKSTILPQNWYYLAHFEENTPPFVILSKKSDKLVLKDEIDTPPYKPLPFD